MRTRGLVHVAILIGVTLVASACTSLLPRSRNESSTFERFEDAQRALETLMPMKSSRTALAELGLNADELPNAADLAKSVWSSSGD